MDGFFVLATALVFLRDGRAGVAGEGEVVDFLVDAADVVLHEGLAVEVGGEVERGRGIFSWRGGGVESVWA